MTREHKLLLFTVVYCCQTCSRRCKLLHLTTDDLWVTPTIVEAVGGCRKLTVTDDSDNLYDGNLSGTQL